MAAGRILRDLDCIADFALPLRGDGQHLGRVRYPLSHRIFRGPRGSKILFPGVGRDIFKVLPIHADIDVLLSGVVNIHPVHHRLSGSDGQLDPTLFHQQLSPRLRRKQDQKRCH